MLKLPLAVRALVVCVATLLAANLAVVVASLGGPAEPHDIRDAAVLPVREVAVPIAVITAADGSRVVVDPSTAEGRAAIAEAKSRGHLVETQTVVVPVDESGMPVRGDGASSGGESPAGGASERDAIRNAAGLVLAARGGAEPTASTTAPAVTPNGPSAAAGPDPAEPAPSTSRLPEVTVPPITLPPVVVTTPPVSVPSVTVSVPPVTVPPVSVTTPAVTLPPVTVTTPPVSTPVVTVPPVTVTTPPVTVPTTSVTTPPVTVTVPVVTTPPVTVPPTTVVVSVPPVTVPVPPVTVPRLLG